MPPPFRTSRRIEFADTDMAGIVHFANFFRWMESAEVDFLLSLGLNVSMTWEGDPIGFPRVSASCDYVRPATFPQILDITVQVASVGQKSVTYAFEFTRQGEVIARGRIVCVCCRVLAEHQLESIPIPPGLRQRLVAAG